MIDKSPTTTLERKPNAARRPEERLMHQEIISREYLKGRLQAEIAFELGLSLATIKRDLAQMRQRWLNSALRDFDALKAEQLAKIDTVEAEAWAMWSRSCERQVRTSTQTIEASHHPGCNTRTDAQQGSGDPRYLQIALQCVERRSKLMGLDASDKIAHTDPSGIKEATEDRHRNMSGDEIDGRIRELEQKRADKMTEQDIRDMVEAMTRGRFTIALSPKKEFS